MLTKIPAVSRDPIRKAVLITPRIFDVASESQSVVNKLGKMGTNLTMFSYSFHSNVSRCFR